MAMVQPIAQSVSAFDANTDKTFTFVSNGGNQVVANKIVIRDNNTGAVVYENKIESYRFEQIVPKGTLQNGYYYNFYFTTFDVQDNESSQSNVITFKCLTTPTVNITNVPVDGIIKNSNFTIQVQYNQIEKELMDFAKIILFDQLGTQIFESENIYNANQPPLNFSYELKGLKDKTTYRVMAKVITVNRMVVESEKELFTTNYSTPSLNSLIELENNCEEGYVKIKNNFKLIDYDSYPKNIGNNPQYLKNGKLYLDEKGTWIDWNSGYKITDDFTLRIFIEDAILDSSLCTIKNQNGDYMTIKLIEDYPILSSDKQFRLQLEAYSGQINIPYLCYSNFVDSISKILIWVRKNNNIYETKLYSFDTKTYNWDSDTGIN